MTSATHTSLVARLDILVIDGRMDAGQAVLTPRGELVNGCTDTLARILLDLPADTGRLDLDMSGVVFMDTAGLQFLDLLGAYGHRQGIPIRTAHWTGQPRRILELAGLDTGDPLPSPGSSAVPDPGSPAASAVAQEREEQLRSLREEVRQLRQAIVSRPVVDQARGVLMATHCCTSDEAWNILREASQLSNTKLRAVASVVTALATADGPDPPEELRLALRTAIAHRAA